MFTSWSQIEEWITDNGFKHWIFYNKDPEGLDDKASNKVLDSNNYGEDMEDKLAMTRKYLEKYGGKVWGRGFDKPLSSQGGMVCEARIEQTYQQLPTSGVAPAQMTQQEIGALRDSISKEIRAQIKAEQYEAERKQFESEKRQFEKDKQSVLGMLVGYLAPYVPVLNGAASRRMVAGIDADAPVEADPLQPIVPKNAPEAQEPEPEEEIFTDEESEKLFALMARFKKAEPEYLQLIEAVVEMAEKGDGMYSAARAMLLK